MKEAFVYPVFVISVTVLCLLTSVSTAATFPFLEEVELRMPHVRPTQNETYLCTAYHVKPNQHEYIVAFNPNASMHVAHHILIYGCLLPGYQEMDSPRAVWDCGEMTHSHSEYRTGSTCAEGPQIIYAWARDAPPLTLPRGVGFKIGGNSGIRYLVLQVHYADTTAFITENKNDSSGVILSVLPGNTPFVTRRAAIYLLGTGGMIRSHETGHFETACRIDEDVILYPFAFRTHTHQLGKAVTGYIVRNGKWIAIGKHDPLQPQMFYKANKNITVQKGDILAARCTMYNFRDRDTYVGATGNDEMCNFYMMYYVEGDHILQQHECFSYGPPIYYWSRDRLLSNALTSEMDKDASTLN